MARQIDTDAVINWERLAQQSGNPASPAAGYWYLFIKSDGLYLKDSGGNVIGPMRGMALDTIWDAAGDLVVGTGANTGARLAKGTALQLFRMKSDASTVEWASLEAVTAASFENSWVNFDAVNYNGAGYYKDLMGIVHLQGIIKDGTNAASAFTLAVGYRPPKKCLFVSICAGGAHGAIARVDVNTDGTVVINESSNSYVSLEGISFRV